jgi:hypothetical protein
MFGWCCSLPRQAFGKLWSPEKGPVQPAYNPCFLTYFFSQNSIFLSQKISRNNVLVCFSA